jgi:hypothetical protein
MSDYFLVKNLYDYELVIPPPRNLPAGLKTVYVTDTDNNCEIAKSLGWDFVKKTELFLGRSDKFERRKSIAFINSYPLKVVPEISDARFIFICDSHINQLWSLYEDFVRTCNEKFTLFITSGYYSGERDNIIVETDAACGQDRWSYGHSQIRDCANRYVKELTEKNVDIKTLSVVSAKYIGWNVTHPEYVKLSNILYDEYCKNLHGNNILTYMSGMFNTLIYNYHTNDYSGADLNHHRYNA